MFGISEGRRAIHMEMEKPVFDREIFAGPSLPMGHREDFGSMGLARLLPITPRSY